MKAFAKVSRQLVVAAVAVILVVGSFFFSAASAEAANVTVKMGTTKGLVFEPAVANIKPGDTVTWEVGQLPPHNVQFDKVPGGDSALAASLSHKSLEGAGKTFSVTFPADAPAGEYSYFCMPHRGAGMVGRIVVN
ncbi:plastocyanin [Alkalinema sp. FACHB-956]|uniref:plastocyanin n=1 Tax=Alkalinema sp. FACHB-956 TaxID=2692768 RepID=UPI001683AFED|nr:plastocyanin [Alkalinema sp. FACHB-956]MBD2325594.1 plastocyanin [Alkalinema sp. FACHB-956]